MTTVTESLYCARCGCAMGHPHHQGRGEDPHLFVPPPDAADQILDAVGVPREDEDSAPRGRTWEPIDLGPILRGEHKPIEPAVGLTRSDGLRLLYPGKEHTVIGEMECGKSWLSTACCMAEITARNHVVYIHFEETDPADTVGRLQALGCADESIIDYFHFVGPEEPVQPYMLVPLLELTPSLVVIDGVNEAMSLHGQGIRDEDGAAAFRRRLVKPFTATGAATLAADHVAKDRETRGRSPIGSVHKGNAVNGSLLMMENADPFGRGQRGRSHVFVVKDRPGYLRRHGRSGKLPGKTFMGTLVVDDTRDRFDYLDLTFWAPAEQEDEGSAEDPRAEVDGDVLAIVRAVTESGQDATGRAVRAKSKYGTDRTADALERLVMDGRVIKTPGPRGAHVYKPATGPDASLQGEVPS